MMRAMPVLWLHPAAVSGKAGRVRTPAFGAPRCEHPRLDGTPEVVQRVLQALRGVGDLGHGHNIVDARHVRALTIDEDEVELQLTFPAACGIHQRISDDAFQALRRELPGRDLYVTHPR